MLLDINLEAKIPIIKGKMHFFKKPRKGNVLCIEFEPCKKRSVPTKPSSFQTTRLHPVKARSYEPKAPNEIMLPMKRKKSFTIPHTQHRTPPIPTPFQPEIENGDVRKRRPTLVARKSR